MTILREWASNNVYIGTTFAGQANKSEPSAALVANGAVPGTSFAAEHLNNELNALTRAALTMRTAAARSFEKLIGVGLSTSFAVVYIPEDDQNFLVDGPDGHVMGDLPLALNVTNVVPLNVKGLAYDSVTGSMVSTVGTTNYYYSTNKGVSWTDSGASILRTNGYLISVGNDIFVAADPSGSAIVSLNGGQTWASKSTGTGNQTVFSACGPSNNSVIGIDTTYAVHSADASDGYTTWTARGLAPDSGSELSGVSWVVEGNGNVAYLPGVFADGIRVYTLAEPTGAWSQQSVVAIPSGFPGGYSRLLIDKEADVVYLVYIINSTQAFLWVSHNRGQSWSEPGTVVATGVNVTDNIFAAGGRLWFRSGTNAYRTALPGLERLAT